MYNIYSWLLHFFIGRTHRTNFCSVVSSDFHINSSVVQGSTLDTPLFIICSSDLHPITPGNLFVKYADDITLEVPTVNTPSILADKAWIEACMVGPQ